MARPLSCFFITIQTEAGMNRKIVDDNPFTIGRSLEAAIAFSDNNISRTHVLVRNKGGKVMVEDQGSANGTFVNDKKLDARKPTQVEPGDVVRLGNSRIELTFSLVEKVFPENVVDQSDLPAEERDAVVDLLHGAHAEAQRLVKLAKEIHDNIVKSAEDRASKIETKISAERDEILNAARASAEETQEKARETARQIVSAAEGDAKKAVSSIHQRAAEVRSQAEEYRHNQVEAAQSQADQIIRQSENICQQMLADAKKRIGESSDQAKAQSHELLAKSKKESQDLIKAAVHEAERLKREAEDAASQARALAENDARIMRADAHREADQLRLESLNEAEKIKTDARKEAEKRSKEALAEALNEGAIKTEEMMILGREKIQVERDKIISEAEESLRETRHEKKKLEGEMAVNLKRLRGELDQLNTELENQQRLMQQKRKVFDDEVAYLRELKEREAQAIFDEKLKEVEILVKQKLQEVERTKNLKEEETKVFVQSKTLEFEKIKRRHEEQVADLKARIEEISPQAKQQAAELTKLQKEVALASERLKELTPKAQSLSQEIVQSEQAKGELIASIKELETSRAHLLREKQAIEEDVEGVKRERDAKLAEQKSVLDAEMAKLKNAQQAELDQLRLEELNRIKQARGEMIEALIRDRQKISNEIFNQVEREVLKFCKSAPWIEASPEIQRKISEALEERSVTMVTSQESEAAATGMAVMTKRRNERTAWIAQGALMGLVLFYLGQAAYRIYEEDANPMKTAAAERAKAVAEDLERRKFDPPQDNEWRDTYAGSVIYTQDFVKKYLDGDFQQKWLKASTTYMLKQWRIEEDTTIEVLAMVNTLVTTLNERKAAIHPDFIHDGLRKMDELEVETLEKVKAALGGEVRVEAFRRYEKRFYHQYHDERRPAQLQEAVKAEAQPEPEVKPEPQPKPKRKPKSVAKPKPVPAEEPPPEPTPEEETSEPNEEIAPEHEID